MSERLKHAISALTSFCLSIAFVVVTEAAEPAKIVSHIRREPIPSSALTAAGYSKRFHIMEIEFCNGAVYRYLDVPPGVYREFMSADSKARYYDWNIKGHYQSLRLRTGNDQASR
jgi:hypothetical protein